MNNRLRELREREGLSQGAGDRGPDLVEGAREDDVGALDDFTSGGVGEQHGGGVAGDRLGGAGDDADTFTEVGAGRQDDVANQRDHRTTSPLGRQRRIGQYLGCRPQR